MPILGTKNLPLKSIILNDSFMLIKEITLLIYAFSYFLSFILIGFKNEGLYHLHSFNYLITIVSKDTVLGKSSVFINLEV